VSKMRLEGNVQHKDVNFCGFKDWNQQMGYGNRTLSNVDLAPL